VADRLRALLAVLMAVPLAAVAATWRDRIPAMSCGGSPDRLGFRRSGWHRAAARVRPQPRRLSRRRLRETLRRPSASDVLPALTVAFGIAPILIRSLRAACSSARSDYVTTARSKPARRRVLVRHASASGSTSPCRVNIGYLVGGTLVSSRCTVAGSATEFNANFARDFPVVQAVTLVFS